MIIDGINMATVEWNGGETGRFYDVEYPLPDGLIRDKTTIAVRIEANFNCTAGRVFGVRTMTDK